jgi:CheY-like chemotaxis protein
MGQEDQGIFEPKVAGVRVLVVDDHSDSLDMLAVMLELHGARTRTATSVAEAMELIAAERPDIVISDLDMPKENGFVLVRRIQETDPALPVVAMTAHDSSEMREEVLAAGFRAHLAKPLDTGEFLAIIASLTAHLMLAVSFAGSFLALG